MMGFGEEVASAGPYANSLHLAADRQPHQHLISLIVIAINYMICLQCLCFQCFDAVGWVGIRPEKN